MDITAANTYVYRPSQAAIALPPLCFHRAMGFAVMFPLSFGLAASLSVVLSRGAFSRAPSVPVCGWLPVPDCSACPPVDVVFVLVVVFVSVVVFVVPSVVVVVVVVLALVLVAAFTLAFGGFVITSPGHVGRLASGWEMELAGRPSTRTVTCRGRSGDCRYVSVRRSSDSSSSSSSDPLQRQRLQQQVINITNLANSVVLAKVVIIRW